MSSSNLSLVIYPGATIPKAKAVHARRWDACATPRMLCEITRLSDGIVMLVGGLVAFHTIDAGVDLAAGHVTLLTLLGAAAASFSVSRGHLYTICALGRITSQLRVAVLGLTAAVLTAAACSYLFDALNATTAVFVACWLGSSAILAMPPHLAAMWTIRQWRREGRFTTRVAVIGAECDLRTLEQIEARNALGITFVGRFEDHPDGDDPVLRRLTLSDANPVTGEDPFTCDAVVISVPTAESERIAGICAALRASPAEILLATDFFCPITANDPVLRDLPEKLVQIRPPPFTERQIVVKRLFDLVVATAALVFLLPLLALAAVAIRLNSPGPVLFRQARTGYGNVPFSCWKFRTMFHEMEDRLADRQTTRDDPRITRVGTVLRKFSIDELPQLFNVIRGDMSIVGPRPHAPNTKAADRLFPEIVDNYDERHRVPPEITGWAQVNGWRGEVRTVDQIRNRVARDLFYIRNYSLALDVKIVLLTAVREIFSENAY